MTGLEVLEKVKEAEKELDKFNLTMAEWRVQNGMTVELTKLYRAMGNLSAALMNAKEIADLSPFINDLI